MASVSSGRCLYIHNISFNGGKTGGFDMDTTYIRGNKVVRVHLSDARNRMVNDIDVSPAKKLSVCGRVSNQVGGTGNMRSLCFYFGKRGKGGLFGLSC